MSQPIQRAGAELDVSRASVTLARAFQHDPFYAFIFEDAQKRAERLPWLLGALLRYAHQHGEVWITPDYEAVACWCGPAHTTLSTTALIALNGLRGARYLGPRRLQKLLMLSSYMEREHASLDQTPHYYLLQLGAEPLRRGRGLGRAALQPVLERADRDRLPCYLETKNPDNISVYRSIGFEMRREVRMPDLGGLTLYTMSRPPQDVRSL